MKKHSAVACISRADLFSSLSSDALKKIAAISTHQEYFPRNTIIRQPGDGKEGMIFMDEGSAKIYSLNEDGKETVLGVINKGDYAGQQSLLKNQIMKIIFRRCKIRMSAQLIVMIFKTCLKRRQI